MSTKKRDLEQVGLFTLTDEHGYTHELVIRREDVTTTNGAMWAVRDEVKDMLAATLRANRKGT